MTKSSFIQQVSKFSVGLLCSLSIFSSSAEIKLASPKVNNYPTFNQAYFNDGPIDSKHMGKLIAVHGKVVEVREGPADQPIFSIALVNSDRQLWIASLVKFDETELKVGDSIKALGYLDETRNEPEYMAKITEDKAFLLGFCYVELSTERPMYFHQWLSKCIAWEKGNNIDEISQ